MQRDGPGHLQSGSCKKTMVLRIRTFTYPVRILLDEVGEDGRRGVVDFGVFYPMTLREAVVVAIRDW